MEKWPFLVNTDGLGISLSFYFKRIKSEPDLQSEACGKFPALRDPVAPEGGEASRPGWRICSHLPHALPSSWFPPPHTSPQGLPPTPCPEYHLFLPFSPLGSASVTQVLRRPLLTMVSGKSCVVPHSCREVWGCSQVLRRRYLWAWPGRDFGHSSTGSFCSPPLGQKERRLFLLPL